MEWQTPSWRRERTPKVRGRMHCKPGGWYTLIEEKIISTVILVNIEITIIEFIIFLSLKTWCIFSAFLSKKHFVTENFEMFEKKLNSIKLVRRVWPENQNHDQTLINCTALVFIPPSSILVQRCTARYLPETHQPHLDRRVEQWVTLQEGTEKQCSKTCGTMN